MLTNDLSGRSSHATRRLQRRSRRPHERRISQMPRAKGNTITRRDRDLPSPRQSSGPNRASGFLGFLACPERKNMAWLETETHFFNPAVQFNTTVIEAGLRSRLRVCTRKRVPSLLGT